jgi:hypothetical protein
MIRKRLTREQQAELAVQLSFCLECCGKLCKKADGEVVCVKCGLFWTVEAFNEAIPFPEDNYAEGACFEGHWQPGNTLAFLKGLGDPTLANGKGKALMRVLAKSPNGATDLGLRAQHIKLLMEWEDPPQLRRVLSRISLLLTRRGRREDWQLADYTGNLARKLVAYKLLTKQGISFRLGDAIVAYAMEKFGLNSAAPDLKAETEDLELNKATRKHNTKAKNNQKPTAQAFH